MLGCTFRYQLFVYGCNCCLFLYIHVFGYPSVVYLSCYLVILYLQFILLLSVHIVYMHELSSLHTHSPGRFLTPWICTSRYWTLCFYCSGVRWDGTLREELELLPIRFRYSYLSYLHIISWFSLYQIQLLFQSLFIWYHAWILICDIAVIMIYYRWNL